MARLPLNGNIAISSQHGEPTGMGHFGKHIGIDWACATGTPVYAPASGKVVGAYTGNASLGNYLEIDMLGLTWRFAHFNSLNVRSGQNINEGDLLGYSGATGLVTGPHLHVDCRVQGTVWNASFNNYRNPIDIINAANSGWKVGDQAWLRATSWRIYKPGVVPVVGNEFQKIRPNDYKEGPNGQIGVIYQIKGTTKYANTFLITTQMYGDAWIYLDSDATKV